MIVIFSFSGDKSTNKLIDWLIFLKVDFVRINLGDENHENITVKVINQEIKVSFKSENDIIIDFEKVCFFYVRGRGFENKKVKNTSNIPNKVFNEYVNKEYNALVNIFYNEVNKKSVGCFPNSSHDKIRQIELAIKVGLLVPNSIITSKKEKIIKCLLRDKNTSIITKAIQENIATEYKEKLIIQRVQRVNPFEIENNFFPSFFQHEIKKLYEIRSFVLDGKCYSISYTSKSNSVDMRDNYSESVYMQYFLPESIVLKIQNLMTLLGLFTGSIDMIKGDDGKYYFLELNPNGQYDWVSQYGFHELDKKIALFLKSKNYEK